MGVFEPRFSHMDVLQHSCHSDRTGFTFAQETYKSWCMLASQNGTFSYAVSGQSGVCGPGEFVLCPPRVALHRRMLEPLMTFHFVLFRWMDARRKVLRIKAATLAGKWTLADWQDGQRAMRQLAQLAGELSPPAVEWRLHILETLIRQAWYERNWGTRAGGGDQRDGSGVGGIERHRPIDGIAHRAARLLEARSAEPLRVQDIAKELRIDRIGLSRRFTRAFGMSPIDYLTTLRLERARNLLATTDLKLEDIAEKCGFANAPYLSRLFRKKLHRTPTSYRERERAV